MINQKYFFQREFIDEVIDEAIEEMLYGAEVWHQPQSKKLTVSM